MGRDLYGDGEISYTDIEGFAEDAPSFVIPSTFGMVIEQSLRRLKAPDEEIIRVLGGTTPSSIDAQIVLAKAYLAAGETERATALVRTLWVDNFLDAGLEGRVLATLGDLIDRDTHWARAMHLMMMIAWRAVSG